MGGFSKCNERMGFVMKVAVIGSRDFTNYALLTEKLDKLHQMQQITTIVSGGAKGADSYGEFWAKMQGMTPLIFEAKWEDLSHPDANIKRNRWGKQYDASAGFRRNKTIIENCDIVFAFWDGSSPGTEDSLNYAKSLKKPIKIFLVNAESELIDEQTIISE